MRLIPRLFLIVFAFMVACAAAGLTMAFGVMAPDFRGLDSDPFERIIFFTVAFFATSYAGATALLPAFIGIVLAEAARLRSLLYYGGVGALIGLAAYYSADIASMLEETTDIPPVGHSLELAAAAGIVAGVVYWLIAGRRAGAWRDPR
jgi:hypothetical protein